MFAGKGIVKSFEGRNKAAKKKINVVSSSN